jgi:hypothetical protein
MRYRDIQSPASPAAARGSERPPRRATINALNSRRLMAHPQTEGPHPITFSECERVHHSKFDCRLAAMGHFRQIDPLPTLSACPLRSDRFRNSASQRIDAKVLSL